MSEETKEEKIARLQGEIGSYTDLLEQGDYRARKLIAELDAIIKAKFPDVQMPVYEKYLDAEEKATFFRSEINRLEKEIEKLKEEE